MLTTINVEPGDFVDRRFITNKIGKRGVLANMGSTYDFGLTGKEMQYIQFDGEAQIFDEGSPLGTDAEKRKGSGDASNFKVPVYPITYSVAQRFPRRFLEIFSGDGYSEETGVFYRAGDPVSMMRQILNQPYQQNILGQFKAYVNQKAANALDFSAIYGVNPSTGSASPLARQNGFLLNTSGDNDANKAKFMPWNKPENMTAGQTPAGNIFKQTARDLAEDGDFSVQGITTAEFESTIADEQTTIGSPAQLADGLPLTARNVSIKGIPLYMSNILPDSTLATNAGVPANTKVDAVLGNFSDRFLWSVTSLGNIYVYDSGIPDNKLELGDLGSVNQVLLRYEFSIAWTFIGGTQMFRVISHNTSTPSSSTAASK